MGFFNKKAKIIVANSLGQETVADHLQSFIPMENGKVIICEIELTSASRVINKKLWEIGFPKGSIVGCIIRKKQTIIPQGNTLLNEGDKLILLSTQEALEQMSLLLTGGLKNESNTRRI